MGSEPLVVDLSSDDEDDDNGGGVRNGGSGTWNDVSFDWEPDFIEAMTWETWCNDAVFVVDELLWPTGIKDKQNLGGLMQKDGNLRDGSDDDCLVLDSDPEQPMPVANDKVGGDEEDDLILVQEKGQVACRDYPHPRHLCATFLFNVSPHTRYCNLCHCYVCDCPAPCKFWGNGDLTTDHCHSTDKDEKWKSLRQRFKRKSVSSHSDKHLDNTLSYVLPAQNQVPLHLFNQVPLTTPSPVSNLIRPCSANSIRNHKSCNQRQPQLSSVLAYRSQRHVPYPARSSPLNPGTIPLPGVACISGAQAPQHMHPHLKRVGTIQSGLKLNTNGYNGAVSRNNHFLRPVHTKGYGTANRLQRAQRLQQQHHLNNQGFEPLSVTAPAYQCQPGGSSVNSRKSWQAVLPSMACNIGLSSNTSGSSYAEEPIAISQPPLNSGLRPAKVDQHIDFRAQSATVNDINPLGAGSNREDNIAEHGHGEETEPSTVQPPNSLPGSSNSCSKESRLESILASVEKMLGEPVSDVPLEGLDPDALLHDLSAPWSTLVRNHNNSNPS